MKLFSAPCTRTTLPELLRPIRSYVYNTLIAKPKLFIRQAKVDVCVCLYMLRSKGPYQTNASLSGQIDHRVDGKQTTIADQLELVHCTCKTLLSQRVSGGFQSLAVSFLFAHSYKSALDSSHSSQDLLLDCRDALDAHFDS